MVQNTVNLGQRQRLQNETSYAERRLGRSHNVARPAITQVKVKGSTAHTPPAAGTPVVMVLAKSTERTKGADVARCITHPTGPGLSEDKPTAWPMDRFTFRRLKEGVIVRADAARK
jgi:hypothetical protein